MKYLLDTCTVSDFIKGEAGVLKAIKALPPERLAISSITSMELAYGLALHPERVQRLRPALDLFLGLLAVLPFEREDAQAAAAVRAALKKRGKPIGAYDLQIAGTALARGYVLVSANLGEFERVAGLHLENWRE